MKKNYNQPAIAVVRLKTEGLMQMESTDMQLGKRQPFYDPEDFVEDVSNNPSKSLWED